MDATLELEMRRLERAWRVPHGFVGWFMVADHRTIGIRYIVTAFVFFILAGILAAAMRLQLALPENHVLTADRYNQFFTAHGLTMMFLFAVPVMEAMGVYLVPLMVGTRNIAFPRLNAYSYYMFLFGGVLLFGALVTNTGSAWLLDMQVSYSMVKWVCENDSRAILLAIPVASLALVAAAAWMAWSSCARLRRSANEEGSGPLDRSYFLALSGLGMSALFALLLLVSIVPRFVLSPCE
jgi:cytochrome c oxidase subunit 1